jgi:hypothetical protein
VRAIGSPSAVTSAIADKSWAAKRQYNIWYDGQGEIAEDLEVFSGDLLR